LPDSTQDPAVDPPAECVTWDVSTSGVPARVRYVRSVAETCGGSPVETTELLSVLESLPGVVKHPFSFRLQCHPTACTSTSPPDGPPAGRPCGTWDETAVTGEARGWIVGIQMRVMSGSTAGRNASVTDGLVDATVRSRTTTDYASALGC
jgi:hypothetical protein